MAISFNVGTNEIHNVTLKKNWFWGSIDVFIDGVKQKRKMNFIIGKKERLHEIGTNEKHYLKLIITIPPFPIFRRWPTEIFIDGNKYSEYNF